MFADVRLRHDPSSETEYAWQVVRIEPFAMDWILHRGTRDSCVGWLYGTHEGDIHEYTLRRVALSKRGKLTDAAKLALEFIVERCGESRKIECIKATRTIFGVGLKEAKEMVEDYLDTI